MKKRILSLALVVVMIAIMLTSFTMAYFTDDEEASNTFTLGGVDITLIEKKYENGWVTLTTGADGKVHMGQLDPGVTNSYNKVVFTINNEDAAYVRNYVAVETLARDYNISAIKYQDVGGEGSEATSGVRHGCVQTAVFENVVIDGKLFNIFVFDTVGNVALQNGDSFMTLASVSLNPTVTNDDAEALGDFEVYTFSEAIQAAGLSHAKAMETLIGEDVTLEAHAKAVMTNLIAPTNP